MVDQSATATCVLTHHFDFGVAVVNCSRLMVGSTCKYDGHSGRADLGEVCTETLVGDTSYGQRVDARDVTITTARVLVHATIAGGPNEE